MQFSMRQVTILGEICGQVTPARGVVPNSWDEGQVFWESRSGWRRKGIVIDTVVPAPYSLAIVNPYR